MPPAAKSGKAGSAKQPSKTAERSPLALAEHLEKQAKLHANYLWAADHLEAAAMIRKLVKKANWV